MIETIHQIAVLLLPFFVTGFFALFIPRKLKEREMKITASHRFREAIHSATGVLLGSSDKYFTLDEISRIKASVDPVCLACRIFAPFLNKRKRLALDKASHAYRKACQEEIPNWNGAKQAAESIVSSLKSAHCRKIDFVVPAQIIKTHVDRLLSFADTK